MNNIKTVLSKIISDYIGGYIAMACGEDKIDATIRRINEAGYDLVLRNHPSPTPPTQKLEYRLLQIEAQNDNFHHILEPWIRDGWTLTPNTFDVVRHPSMAITYVYILLQRPLK